jgi:lambda family phage portal protein
MMNVLDRAIAAISPTWAQKRAAARQVLAHYAAAGYGPRQKGWRADPADATGAAARRERLAYISRDMIRNTPYAARIRDVITNNVVGDGIIPKIRAPKAMQRQGLDLIERHFDTPAIDAAGRLNLYGLQRLAMSTIVESGEVLIRLRRRQLSDGLPLPFQLQVLEPDHFDTTRTGELPNGNELREGIEFDRLGRRVAYHLWQEHPGKATGVIRAARVQSRRVPADQVLHVYRLDRAEQIRGVPWMAAVALNLQDLGDYMDAELMRQKIAACFAAFRTSMDGAVDEDGANLAGTLRPGAIMQLAPGEDIKFGTPPLTNGISEFPRMVLQSVAAGVGITYESLVGDLSNVNFSSARMGRTEMDRMVNSWQWTMMIPQMMQPIGRWFLDAWVLQSGSPRVSDARVEWVPPHRILVDPTREVPALRDQVRAGFKSRQAVIRELGFDPERLIEEQIEDRESADAAELQFDSDPRHDASKMRQQANEVEPE